MGYRMGVFGAFEGIYKALAVLWWCYAGIRRGLVTPALVQNSEKAL